MAQSILIWLKSHDLASTWADVAGLLGFVITICVAIGAKRAAKAAKNAAEATRDKIRFYESAVDFQSAILGL